MGKNDEVIVRKRDRMYLTGAQHEVQDRVDRKRTSTYFTSPDGINVVRELLKSFPRRGGIVVMDPFMDSGVLLSAIDDLVIERIVTR